LFKRPLIGGKVTVVARPIFVVCEL